MKIHISRSGQQMGPYPLEQVNQYLEQGALLPTDSAWHDGMTDWVPLNQINGVVISGESLPLPLPPETTPPAPPTPQENTTACPQCHAPIEADQAFCMGCGANLKNDQLDLGQPMMPTTTSAKKNKSKLIKIAGVAIGGIIALLAIGFFIHKNSVANNLLKVHNAIVEAEREFVNEAKDVRPLYISSHIFDFSNKLRKQLDGRDAEKWGIIYDCPKEYQAQYGKLQKHLLNPPSEGEFKIWEQQRQEKCSHLYCETE